MTTNIFIVTQGQYSDYRIESVWLTQAEAEVARDLCDDEDWNAARIEVWPIGEEKRTLGFFYRAIELNAWTGEVLDERQASDRELTKETETSIRWEPDGTPSRLIVQVSANTLRRCNKRFSELRAQVLAHISSGLPSTLIANEFYSTDERWHPISEWHLHPIPMPPPRPRRAGEVSTGDTELHGNPILTGMPWITGPPEPAGGLGD